MSNAPHIDLDALATSNSARIKWHDEIRRRGAVALRSELFWESVAYAHDWQVTEKTFQLAEHLGVKKVIMMSGLPAGCPGDQTPVWITTSWPPETQDILEYQWNEVAIPKWTLLSDMAKNHGIEQIALENHGMQLVYNPETLLRLRTAIGPIIGMNLDPSHLFWMGGDPIEAARVLGAVGAFVPHSRQGCPQRTQSIWAPTACWTRNRSIVSVTGPGTMWL